jgi:hypothetical protein
MTREFGLSFDRNEVYECGASLLTILAYPAADEKEHRLGKIHASLCARALRRAYSPPNHLNPIPMKPLYAFQDIKVVDKDVKDVDRKFQERLVAGRMAVPFLLAVEAGEMPKMPQSIRRLSLNEIATFVLEESGQADPVNVETRVWRASRLVIHLAAAATIVRQEYLKQGVAVGLDDLLERRDVIEEIVRRSELLHPLAIRAPKLGLTSAELVRVRLV